VVKQEKGRERVAQASKPRLAVSARAEADPAQNATNF